MRYRQHSDDDDDDDKMYAGLSGVLLGRVVNVTWEIIRNIRHSEAK